MQDISWDALFITSQIITVIYYGLLAWTYLLKSQRNILIVNSLVVILNAIAYALLGAWTGLMMCAVALIRNIVIYVSEKKHHKFGTSWLFLLLIFIAIVAATIPTYDGFLSLMSVFATSVYSYSIWQPQPRTYKLCGIPVGILWIIYNISVGSIFGIILESALFLFVVVSIIRDTRTGKLNTK